MASTSTTTVPDAKARPVKEKREKDTERVKEKEQGGEGPIKLIMKMRKVDDEERNDGMPSRNQRSKKGMEVEVETVDLNSMHLGLRRKKQ